MLPTQAWDKAAECERLAETEADPARRLALEFMRDLWINLANEIAMCGADALAHEFEQLLAVEEIFREHPAPVIGGTAAPDIAATH